MGTYGSKRLKQFFVFETVMLLKLLNYLTDSVNKN